MPTHPDLKPVNDDPDFDEIMLDDDEEISPAPAWLISLSVHALVLLILSLIVFGSIQEEEPPVKQVLLDRDEIIEKKDKEPIDIKEEKIEIKIDEEVEEPVITDLEIEPEELSTEDPVEEVATEPNGDPEMTATSEMASNASFAVMGSGSTAPGLKGQRTRGSKRGLGKKGGSRESQRAVEAALHWFKRHQSPNGQWDVDGYMDNCQDDLKCEPGTAHTQAGGDGDAACTAYATLCFLGTGYDHKTPGKFKDTVHRALEWLKANQKADGGFGKNRNYENGVCTMALCDAYAMTMDPSLKEPAQKAVDKLLSNQARTDKYPYGIGWNYTGPNAARNDSSVTGWCVMALKVAKQAGLDVGDGWEGSRAWLDGAWAAANPGKDPASMASDEESGFPYTWNARTDETKKAPSRACIGALCAVFLGHRPGDGMLDSLINYVMANDVPQGYPCNTYYMYYNTLAVFQYGGESWKQWNAQVRDMLVDAQHDAGSGCFTGSWDYKGTEFHGHDVGRLLSTAYCCLSLEVYYRYERVAEHRGM